jgi:hypothetical protein
MLLKVQEVGNTYREHLSSSPAAASLFAAVTTAIDDLTTTDMQKRSASGSARADRKAQARQALLDLLTAAGRLARVLRAGGHMVPPCDLPVKSDRALLTAGRQLALDAAAHAEFAEHGITVAHVTELTEALAAAVGELGTGRAAHVAACARIQDLLATIIPEVRRLDVVIASELAQDKVARAVWKQARRLQQARLPSTPDQPVATATPPVPEKEVAM